MYNLLLWNRYIKLNRDVGVAFPSVNYQDFTEIGIKAASFSRILEHQETVHGTVDEKVFGKVFKNENDNYFKNIASSLELIIQQFENPNPTIQLMVNGAIDYVNYNWK